MSEKISLARLKKFGQTFELSIDPDKALDFKNGRLADVFETLLAEQVFTDAHKGQIAAERDLLHAFQTTDLATIAAKIITEGEIQYTGEHRQKERDQKLRLLIDLIHAQAVDPKTKIPHPATRIEAALKEAKFNLDEHRSAEEQLETALKQLQPLLPLKIEQKTVTLTIEPQQLNKLHHLIKNNYRIVKEEWTPRGEWRVRLELPAGRLPDLIDKVNALTHGQALIEIND